MKDNCFTEFHCFLYMPRTGIAGSYGGFMHSFLRNLHTSSIVAVSIHIPTNSVGGFLLLHTFSSTYCLQAFGDGHLTSVKWYLIVVLICISLIIREGLPWCFSGKKCKRHGFDPRVGKIPLEKEMATHSNILAWEIPWTEDPGRPLHGVAKESDMT